MADVASRCAHHLSEWSARHRPELTGAAAARASLDRRARLGAVAVAVLAQRDDLVADVDFGPVRGFGQVDLGADADVAALDRATGPPAAATEGAAESAAASEERLEDVRHRPEALEVGCVTAAAQAVVAVAVIGGPALRIG